MNGLPEAVMPSMTLPRPLYVDSDDVPLAAQGLQFLPYKLAFRWIDCAGRIHERPVRWFECELRVGPYRTAHTVLAELEDRVRDWWGRDG